MRTNNESEPQSTDIQQENLFDSEELRKLREESAEKNTVTLLDVDAKNLWAKEPVLLSDVAVGLISEDGLTFETVKHALPNGETVQSQVPVKVIPGTAASPHFIDLNGTIQRREECSPTELRYARPIIVDVDTRVEYHTAIMRPHHYHVVMVVSAMWAQRYRNTGNRSPVMTVTRAQIAEMANLSDSRQFQRAIIEALYGMQGAIVTRTWDYSSVEGIPSDIISSSTAMTIIRQVEVEGLEIHSVAREVNEENARRSQAGQRMIDGIPLAQRPGGRAKQIKITFTQEFVEASISGQNQGGRISFDKAVRNLSIPGLARYRGWKANAYRSIDQRLERLPLYQEPFNNFWMKVTGCPIDHTDDPKKMKDARSKVRALLATWEKDAYIEWLDQPGYQTKDRGVHLLPKKYRARIIGSDGLPESAIKESGYWISFARGPNYDVGRPPTRLKLWSEIVIQAGVKADYAQKYIEQEIGYERIRAANDVMRELAKLMGDSMNRVRGPAWFNIADIVRDKDDAVFQRIYSESLKTTEAERAETFPLSELEKARRLQAAGALKTADRWAKEAGYPQTWRYLLDIEQGKAPTQSATRIALAAWHRRVLEQILDENNSVADDYIGPKAHLRKDHAMDEWHILNEQAYAIALRIFSEIFWSDKCKEMFEKAFGEHTQIDWETPPETFIRASRKIIPAYPEAWKLIKTWSNSGIRTSWETTIEKLLERRAIELHIERAALNLKVPIEWRTT